MRVSNASITRTVRLDSIIQLHLLFVPLYYPKCVTKLFFYFVSYVLVIEFGHNSTGSSHLKKEEEELTPYNFVYKYYP